MKKINQTILITMIVIVIIIATIVFIISKGNSNNVEDNISDLKTEALYEELSNKDKYVFIVNLDDNNTRYYAKQNDSVSYMDIIYEGEESKLLSKDGNQYLIVDDEKKYYTYTNNESDLNIVEESLQELFDSSVITGKDKIDNKEYYFEEYLGYTNLVMGDFSEDENVKTRYYFKNDTLVYIKTISDQKEELLKVEISDEIDKKAIFEIPSDYKEN